MLVISICAEDTKGAISKINQALLYPIDIVEIRLDHFSTLKKDDLIKIKNFCNVPIIFTLRKRNQGGIFVGSERKRLQIIKWLFSIEPEYFDLEYDIPHSFVEAIHKKYPKIKLICSYHNFEKTPRNLSKILKLMIQKEFTIFKIATYAHSSLDSLRMLSFIQANNKYYKICGLCMGELGTISRILSPLVNNYLVYASIDSAQISAPGQLSLKELFNTYNYQRLNQDTCIYALLGNPIKQSIGHIFHNNVFKKINQNAVYVKLQINKTELPCFFSEVIKLPFKGFSVTMPLKEAVIPFLTLSKESKKISAVNTIVKKNNKFVGYNTDGIGALCSIKKISKIRNKIVAVLGAGGTAKAIIHEALKEGAKVKVLNRTINHARNLKQIFGCEVFGLECIGKIKYDILINATSVGMLGKNNASILPPNAIISKTIVLDMVYKPYMTKLLQIARMKKCIYITGKTVFVNQALEQDKLWFNNRI